MFTLSVRCSAFLFLEKGSFNDVVLLLALEKDDVREGKKVVHIYIRLSYESLGNVPGSCGFWFYYHISLS